MMKINHTFRAISPLYTGGNTSLGFKSELRKQKVKIANSETIISQFNNENDRESAMTDIVSILYLHLNPDYRMKRGSDIWKEYKTGLLSSCGAKSKSNFLTRFAQRFDVGKYDTILLKYLNFFNDTEFLQVLTDNIDYLITKMRLIKETKNVNHKRLKEIEKEIEKLVILLEKEQDNMFSDDIAIKENIDKLNNEYKELDLEKSGLLFDVDNYKSEGSNLTYRKDFENVPYFSGNSIAGIMRRLIMSDYFRRLGVDNLFDFTYHTFFTGGSLTDNVDSQFVERLAELQHNLQEKLHKTIKTSDNIFDKSGEVSIEKSEQLAYFCPPLRLFGTATKGGMIESEMIVSNARLKCKENGNGESTLWSLIEDTFYTRRDSEKTERNFEVMETSGNTTQMKYIMETLIEGSEFEHSFVLRSNNKYVEMAFHKALYLFANYHRIGGKSARGLGDIDLEELIEHIDYTKVSEYDQHLENTKGQIKEFLGVA